MAKPGIGWRALAAACAVLAVGAPAADAAQGIVAQWRFDEPSGQSVLDDGPGGLDGHLGALATPDGADPQRLAGGALRFDGNSFVELPATPLLALQNMTVEAVVRAPSSPGEWRYVLSRGGRGCYASSWGLYTAESGGIALYVFDGEHYYVSATARPTDVWNGDWHDVVGTFDGSALRLYVDGHPVGDPFSAPVQIDYRTTSDRAAIGQYVGSCDLAYRGDLDLVRVSAEALTPPVAGGGDPLIGEQPLPPAAPGAMLDPPKIASPPKPSCTLKLSRTRIVAHRRTVVHARVGLRKVTVAARRTSRGKPLAQARTDASGSARLVIKAPHVGELTVGVTGRSDCRTARLRVVAR